MNWAAGELNLMSVISEQLFLNTIFPKSTLFGDYFRSNWFRDNTRSLPQICGAFMVIRSAEFNKVGGFDSDYWMYCEDTDLCARIRRMGLSCDYLHTATATHYHGTSSKGELRPKMVLEHNVSRCLYLMKFYGRDQAQRARRIMILGAFLRCTLWLGLGALTQDKAKIAKGKGYIRVLYGTRKIVV
jgi:GT2 family glycosyltransferase